MPAMLLHSRIRLHAEAWILCLRFRMLLWRWPVRAVLAEAQRLTPPWNGSVRGTGDGPELAWAIHRAARLSPGSTCLVRALALHVMLARRGLASVLRIGAARAQDGDMEAHAWVEHAGQVLLGGDGQDRYVALLSLEFPCSHRSS